MQALATRLIFLAGLAVFLPACSTSDPLAESDDKSVRKADRPESATAALARADELRMGGKPIQALARLADAHGRFPQDPGIASAYGRVALLLGHDEVAGPLLAQAVAANPRDWRALSAQGVLESRRGRQPDARRAMTKATMVSASEAVILNNLAMSHMLEGKPAAAVSLLRQGLASPELRPQHEQRLKRNLALALAVQGRFEEADRLAGESMPRDLAHADAQRVRRLLGVTEPEKAADLGWQAQYASPAYALPGRAPEKALR
jgi:Flp pilus assembly protein TadD